MCATIPAPKLARNSDSTNAKRQRTDSDSERLNGVRPFARSPIRSFGWPAAIIRPLAASAAAAAQWPSAAAADSLSAGCQRISCACHRKLAGRQRATGGEIKIQKELPLIRHVRRRRRRRFGRFGSFGRPLAPAADAGSRIVVVVVVVLPGCNRSGERGAAFVVPERLLQCAPSSKENAPPEIGHWRRRQRSRSFGEDRYPYRSLAPNDQRLPRPLTAPRQTEVMSARVTKPAEGHERRSGGHTRPSGPVRAPSIGPSSSSAFWARSEVKLRRLAPRAEAARAANYSFSADRPTD